MVSKSIDQRLSSRPDDGPATGVPGGHEDEGGCGRAGRLKRQYGMSRHSCEQSTGSGAGEPRTGERCCGQECGKSEASEQKRMLRKVLNRSEKFGRELGEMADERIEQRA